MRDGAPLPEAAGIDGTVAALWKFRKSFSRPRRRIAEADAAREAVAAMGARGASASRLEAWAVEAAPRLVGGARYVINQEQYDRLCARFRRELSRQWRDEAGTKLSFGLAAGLVDRAMMALGESEGRVLEQVGPFLRTPLDARTIAPLRTIIDGLTEADWAIEIPSRPSIGFISTEELYHLVQGAIAELAGRAGIAQIDYAYWCAGLG